jgi:demethylmenaquinone methyltransferase/2-methoxy-6-polyprenyl-1,4-benzoquinol methylase
MSVTPYGTGQNKKEEVRQMFDSIAGSYDFLNHALSMNIDKRWRKRLIREIGKIKPARILDVATGTADLALAALKLDPEHVTGLDISAAMLEVGRKKIIGRKVEDRMSLVQGDSENMPFMDNEFDAAMVAFGVRNFEDPLKGLKEMFRVIKPGGLVAVLEFTMPQKFPVRPLYKFYFTRILPLIGKIISRDLSAYKYLPDSVEAFAQGKAFLSMMESAGYKDLRCISLSFGISSIYLGSKE